MKDGIILSHFQAELLKDHDKANTIQFSPNLGVSTTEIYRDGGLWILPDGSRLPQEIINTIADDKNSCFLFNNHTITKIEAYSSFTDRYYSLYPTKNAPTLLISGIPMHRIKDTTPLADTKQKIKALKKPYGRILDTTTGLGYTAIQAARTADSVITIEFDPAVHEICRSNPWSSDLFTNPVIHPIIGDSADLVAGFEDGIFDVIIHDPPTFSLAGHLYSREMYRQLYRILKPGGRLFHYIGNPQSQYGATTGSGVVLRLRAQGFRVTPKERAFGVLAVK